MNNQQLEKAFKEYAELRENFKLINIEPLKMNYEKLLEYLKDNGLEVLKNQITYKTETGKDIISVNAFSNFHNKFINFSKKEC